MKRRLKEEVNELKRSLEFLTSLQAVTLGLLIRRGTVSCEELSAGLEEAITDSSPDQAQLLTILQAQLHSLN